MKEAGEIAGLFCLQALCFQALRSALAFIGRSQNKPHGTRDAAEHRASAFVVGRAYNT
jgi:hypothetical protein